MAGRIVLSRALFALAASVACFPLTGCNGQKGSASDSEGQAQTHNVAANSPSGAADLAIPSVTDGGRSVPSPQGSVPVPSKKHQAPGEDAVAAPLFEGWPSPKVALFLTGQQKGYIEPCGCTGLVNQKGGLARRHTLARQLVERGWPLVPIDVGNQVGRFGKQSEIKFRVAVDGLKTIGYRTIAFGVDDLRLSALELVNALAESGDSPTKFVSANVVVLDPALTQATQLIELGGMRIGITAVLGSELGEKVGNSEIAIKNPEEALKDVVAKLKAESCDVLVLLAHASIEESKRLAQKFPVFDVVVTAGGMGDPAYQPEPIPDTKAVLVQVGIKGMFVGVLGFFDDAQQRLRYQRVPLDARFGDSPEMLHLLASYQDELKALGLEGLGLKPIPHSSAGKFVGSEACKECHSDDYAIWAKSDHAHALESLVNPGERSEVPRHFDPECLSCHVVGWDPQKHFPYATGYLGLKETAAMHNVGCENCHGPGAEHAAAESGDAKTPQAEIDRLRLAVRLPLEEAEKKCMDCHDLDNSINFHKEGAFQEFWAKVEHGPGIATRAAASSSRQPSAR